MNKAKNVWLIIAAALVIGGCTSSVQRIDASEQVDLSGQWNDTDSQLVAQKMVTDSLARPWFSKFLKENGREPVVIVGQIKNLSHEHINTNTFIADIERELINSGNVQFVASADARDEIRLERNDQAANSTLDTINEMGQEIGADFMMQGQINTIIDTENVTQVRFYQVNLELISIKDNRKVWIGEQKIKKLVKNANLRK
ncbi:penicillin-binding protein activator LpoB [Psychromonas sp. PT13]|uniref:penicillin-binding protein activator LpoB n=1 Tax=Psychromonas sp. PT13 TaxID=3439547 RepID=UPI003EB8CCD7